MSRKTYTPKKKTPTDTHVYAEFIGDFQTGVVTATKLVDTKNGNSRVSLQYDDPNS